jgi:ribosome-associated protein
MNLSLLRASLERIVQFDFVRSSGPGGQNVNKTSTKAIARVALSDLEGLSGSERERIRERLANRLTAGGELITSAQDERSQVANRTAALTRLESLIVKAAYKPKERRPTRPTRASRERRIKQKKVRSEVKRSRGHPDDD